MKLNKSSLPLAAFLVIGTAQMASAQQTIAIPDGSTFNDALNAPGNTEITATVGTSYVVGPTMDLTGSPVLTTVTPGTWGSEAAVCIFNSTFPTLFAYAGLGGPTGTFTSLSLPTGSKTLIGSLMGLSVAGGSTTTLRLFETYDDLTGAADSSITGASITVNSGPAVVLPATVQNFAFAGTFPAAGDAGDASNAILTATASSTYNLTAPIKIISGSYESLINGTWPNDLVILVKNDAFPTSTMTFTPYNGTGPVAPNTVLPWAVTAVTGAGTLVNSVIPSGSNFSFELTDYDDDPMSVDAQLISPSWGFSGTAAPTFSQTISLAGPFDTIDAPGDTNNVFSSYVTTSSLQLAANSIFSGTYTQVNAFSYASEARMRLRDTAQPTLYADLTCFTGNAVPSEVVSAAPRTLAGPLVSANIASGANLSIEFFESFQDSADLPEGQISGIALDLYSTAPASQVLSGTLNLGDTGGAFAFNRSIGYTVKQGTSTIGSGTVVASASASSFSISLPASATGAATIEWDGSSFLLRKTNVNLTGSNAAIGSVTMQNGDVDNTGEVDAADIDQVIADFGLMTDVASDVDVSGEVDAADIDIVIANFGGMND